MKLKLQRYDGWKVLGIYALWAQSKPAYSAGLRGWLEDVRVVFQRERQPGHLGVGGLRPYPRLDGKHDGWRAHRNLSQQEVECPKKLLQVCTVQKYGGKGSRPCYSGAQKEQTASGVREGEGYEPAPWWRGNVEWQFWRPSRAYHNYIIIPNRSSSVGTDRYGCRIGWYGR